MARGVLLGLLGLLGCSRPTCEVKLPDGTYVCRENTASCADLGQANEHKWESDTTCASLGYENATAEDTYTAGGGGPGDCGNWGRRSSSACGAKDSSSSSSSSGSSTGGGVVSSTSSGPGVIGGGR